MRGLGKGQAVLSERGYYLFRMDFSWKPLRGIIETCLMIGFSLSISLLVRKGILEKGHISMGKE